MNQETKQEMENRLPDAPLTCLKTADFKSTKDAFVGKNSVIGKKLRSFHISS